MEYRQELKVGFDKKTISMGLFYMAPFMMFVFGFLFYQSLNLYGIIGFIVQTVIMFFIIIFSIVMIHSLILYYTNAPAVIINKDGIDLRYYGFIPWNEVAQLERYRYKDSPMESIAINVNNLTKLKKQSTLSGKIGIFWSQRFNTPHISLANLDLPNDEILIFAHRFYKIHTDNNKI